MLGIKAAVRDQTIEGWAFDDFRSLILRQKLEVCAQLPFSSKTAYFLADSTQGQMVDIANNINSSYELPPELLKSALTCLSQLKIGVNTPQNTRSIAKATATLLPNEAELKSWIMQESEFWKAAVAFSKKAQTLDDWAGEIL